MHRAIMDKVLQIVLQVVFSDRLIASFGKKCHVWSPLIAFFGPNRQHIQLTNTFNTKTAQNPPISVAVSREYLAFLLEKNNWLSFVNLKSTSHFIN